MSSDEEDFRQFVHEQGRALQRTAHLLVGDRGHAEDLLQDVLVRVYARWPQIRAKGDAVAYVRRSIANAATSRWRRLGRRVSEVPHHAGHDRAAPDATVAVDQRDELRRALGQLSRLQRAVLVLRYWEDLSEAETAAALGCSVGTVKSHASRGLARLRPLLGVDVPDSAPPRDTVTRTARRLPHRLAQVAGGGSPSPAP